MQYVIGLGRAGVNIAKCFSKYPQYKTYTIDCEMDEAPNHFLFPKCGTHEEYERSVPDLSGYFKDIPEGEDVLFVLGGSGAISGASLAILQQLNKRKIHILYVRPDVSLISEKKSTHERIVFGVLQEYARSGVLERIILVDNVELDKIVGGAPVIGYYDELNKILVSAIHMVNVFHHSNSIMDTFAKPLEVARITTIGVVDMKKNEEKLFFPLTGVREKSYYYAVNDEILKTDRELFNTITQQMKEKIIDDKLAVSYGVYSTHYKNNYGFLVARCSMVQGISIEQSEEE
tara:strand:- start:310 stop:1176 length:867 start_codon:yes stop_codon:yes gene_type:complete